MKNNIFILFLFSQILAQQDNWTLKSIQSNCPDIGTDEVCEGTPFSEFTVRGSEGDDEDDERWWWVSDSTLGLSNYDKGSNKSGSFKIVVRKNEGFIINDSTFGIRNYTIKIKFKFETKGDRDFLNDIFPQISENKDGILEVGDDYFVAQLNGGDEFSVDIDDEWSGIPSFRLKSKGKIIVESDAKDGSIDDESFLTLLNVSKEEKEIEGIPNSISFNIGDKVWTGPLTVNLVNDEGDLIKDISNDSNFTKNLTGVGERRLSAWQEELKNKSKAEIKEAEAEYQKENINISSFIEEKLKLVNLIVEKKELELKNKGPNDFIESIIEAEHFKEEELKQGISKFYPIYLYTFIKGAAYMGDNQMYSPALISIPYELEETIKASGVQFYVLNKPGIPIYRKIEKLSNGKKYFTYSREGSEDEKIFDTTLDDKLGSWRVVKVPPMTIDGKNIDATHSIKSLYDRTIITTYPNGSVFISLDNVSEFVEYKESERIKSFVENKPAYFLENLDRLELLGDSSDMIKKELAKIESSIRKIIQIPYTNYTLIRKERKEERGYYDWASPKAKDQYTLALLSMRNPTQAQADFLKAQYQNFIVKEIVVVQTKKEIKKNIILDYDKLTQQIDPMLKFGNKNRSSINRVDSLIIKPKWTEVVKFYGGYSELAKNKISKANYEDGLYDAKAKLTSIELLNSNECLAIINISGALELNNIPKKQYKYKGTYKIEDYDLVNIYNKNIPKMIFSFNNKKYLGSSNEFHLDLVKVDLFIRNHSKLSYLDGFQKDLEKIVYYEEFPDVQEKIENQLFRYTSYDWDRKLQGKDLDPNRMDRVVFRNLYSIDMMFDDAISDEDFGKLLPKIW